MSTTLKKLKRKYIIINMEKEEKITFHQLFWYFIIFSVVGIIIETLYCYATTGVLESRKGLIWGAFCPVYGVSAAVLILFLNKYKGKNIFELFIYGFIAGSVAEYILSFGLEAVYGMRFWDYSYVKYHINGRICMQYSFYWGILTVLLIKYVKPILDKVINKIPKKARGIVDTLLLIFFIINCIFTIWGIQTYQNRVVNRIKHQEQTSNLLVQCQQNIENNYFTNERMSRIFPNLRIKDANGNEIWVKTLIKENGK